MNIEKINIDSITDIETVKVVIKQLIDSVFEMKRDFSRQLNNLSSQNVKTLDFNITTVKNIEKVLPKKEVSDEEN